jgi:hypothetical protein
MQAFFAASDEWLDGFNARTCEELWKVELRIRTLRNKDILLYNRFSG